MNTYILILTLVMALIIIPYIVVMESIPKEKRSNGNIYIFKLYADMVIYSTIWLYIGINITNLANFKIDSLKYWYQMVCFIASSLFLIKYFFSMVNIVIKCYTYPRRYFTIHMSITHIIQIIMTFAGVFYCIYLIDNKSFSNITESGNLLAQFIDFVYFSFVTFTTVGYGDIHPVSIVAKIFVIFEIIVLYMVIGVGVVILKGTLNDEPVDNMKVKR